MPQTKRNQQTVERVQSFNAFPFSKQRHIVIKALREKIKRNIVTTNASVYFDKTH